ncbi:hypothetical protein Rsph17029_4113 (plasmid) [Cereibacter sphaeroides ATCC 17029]|nr:hypothetical protein Rsph17029_4113 [Cereibacter sphaeroides ATCC 17029]
MLDLLDPVVAAGTRWRVSPGGDGTQLQLAHLHGHEGGTRPAIRGLLRQQLPDQGRDLAGGGHGRDVERTDLLQPGRSPDRDQDLAPALQHKAPAFIAGPPSPVATGRAVAGFADRTLYAGHLNRGAETCHALKTVPPHGGGPLRHSPIDQSSSETCNLQKTIVARSTQLFFRML